MFKYIAVVCLSLFLIGCETTPLPPISIPTPVIVDKTPLVVPTLEPAKQFNFRWYVINPANQQTKFTEVMTAAGQATLFGVTPDDYQNLNESIAELRRYIHQQDSVIEAYKSYYDAQQKKTPSQ